MRLCVRSIRARVVPITPITGPALTSGPTPPARHRARVELHRTAIRWPLELHPPPPPDPRRDARFLAVPGDGVSAHRSTAMGGTAPLRPARLPPAASCEPGASKLTNTGPSSRAFFARSAAAAAASSFSTRLRSIRARRIGPISPSGSSPGSGAMCGAPGAGRRVHPPPPDGRANLGVPPAAADC